MTLVEIKRRVRPGQVYDVTNHHIERTHGPAAATVRATVHHTLTGSFFLTHPLGQSQVRWPAAFRVSMTRRPDVIELRDEAGERWLTLAFVREGPS